MFSGNSEADASELQENIEEMFSAINWYNRTICIAQHSSEGLSFVAFGHWGCTKEQYVCDEEDREMNKDLCSHLGANYWIHAILNTIHFFYQWYLFIVITVFYVNCWFGNFIEFCVVKT